MASKKPIVLNSSGQLEQIQSGDVIDPAFYTSGSGIPIAAAGGTVDAITADFSPDLTLTDKTLCAVVASGANTITNPTFAPDGLTAKTIKARANTALKVADIPGAKFVMLLEYNAASDYWELLNPSQTRNPLNLYNASTPSSAEGDIYYDASIGLFYGNNSIAGGADAIPTLILADSRYAAKNNAALTGNPTAPTAADGDNDTSIATTAFTQNALRFPPMQAGGGTVDAITATFTPALTLTDKIRCYIVAAGANTITNPTFAPNSLTARTITRFGGQELVPGDIYGAGHVLLLEYNSANTRWELLNPAYPPVNYMSLTATYTGSSQTALQKLFNTPSNGSFTAVAGITYEFECQFSLSSMSGSSGTFSFGFLGTATFTSLFYIAMTRKSAATVISSTVATITAITASDTTTTGIAYIRGTLRVNAAGTIIPAFGLGVAAAAVVGVNSFFKIWPIGTNTFTSKGAFT